MKPSMTKVALTDFDILVLFSISVRDVNRILNAYCLCSAEGKVYQEEWWLHVHTGFLFVTVPTGTVAILLLKETTYSGFFYCFSSIKIFNFEGLYLRIYWLELVQTTFIQK